MSTHHKQDDRTDLLANQPTLTMNSSPSENPQHYPVQPSLRQFANPAPLGLCAFATTTFLLSLFNIQCRGVKTENLILGLAFGYGGVAQLLAGMWEFACGNTFGATAFSSYGGFWISFGLILWPQSGILAAYSGSKTELENALGLYLFSWFIFTSIMLLASLRTSVGLVALFFFLDVTFLMLGVGKFYPETVAITKAGGVFGLITSAIAWYVAASSLFSAETSVFKLPVIPLVPRKPRDE